MSNIQNKLHTLSILLNTKREYMIIPIIPIGAYLYIYTKTTLLITILEKYSRKNFLSKENTKREVLNERRKIKTINVKYEILEAILNE